MEVLDRCFENVCELDLIFHMDKVHFILNEMIMGGMVLGNPLLTFIAFDLCRNKSARNREQISRAGEDLQTGGNEKSHVA